MSVRNLIFTAALLCWSCLPKTAALAQDVGGGPMQGELVYHGNYCGPGHKGRHPAPVDALDEACMQHDACTVDFQIPACSCNDRLRVAATRIAQDPRAPADEREAAGFTMRGVALLPCK